MKLLSAPLFSILLTLCMICSMVPPGVHAADIRKPAKAGLWYPADPFKLRQDIENLTRLARRTHVQIPQNTPLRALILPHAAYQFSGLTAAHASIVLTGKQFSKVILMGPDHYVGFKNGAISAAKAYQTPLGLVNLHADAKTLRETSDLFEAIPASDRQEHSLEIVLLFLQSYLNNFELVPIVVGPTDIAQFTSAIEPILDPHTLLVVSSDLSHYLPYDEAVARDKETINRIMDLKTDSLLKSKNRACGIIPITILLNIARRHHWQPVLLHYSNSGDTSGDHSRVVGYAAIAFFGDSAMPSTNDYSRNLNRQQGQVLLKLARCTLMERLGQKPAEAETRSLDSALKDRCFQSCCGTFVTLKIDGRLRGCIGNLTAKGSVADGVRRNAVNAAFHDPRFAPLTAEELDQVAIEISILTAPQPLVYLDSAELLKKLRPNIDGVIIRKGFAGATFLPQVWEQLPRPEEFLSRLCTKAGLLSDAWLNSGIEVLTYQVQYFEEHK